MKPPFKKLSAKPSRLGRKGAASATHEIIEELEERLTKLEAALNKHLPPAKSPDVTTYIPPYNFQKEPLF